MLLLRPSNRNVFIMPDWDIVLMKVAVRRSATSSRFSIFNFRMILLFVFLYGALLLFLSLYLLLVKNFLAVFSIHSKPMSSIYICGLNESAYHEIISVLGDNYTSLLKNRLPIVILDHILVNSSQFLRICNLMNILKVNATGEILNVSFTFISSYLIAIWLFSSLFLFASTLLLFMSFNVTDNVLPLLSLFSSLLLIVVWPYIFMIRDVAFPIISIELAYIISVYAFIRALAVCPDYVKPTPLRLNGKRIHVESSKYKFSFLASFSCHFPVFIILALFLLCLLLLYFYGVPLRYILFLTFYLLFLFIIPVIRFFIIEKLQSPIKPLLFIMVMIFLFTIFLLPTPQALIQVIQSFPNLPRKFEPIFSLFGVSTLSFLLRRYLSSFRATVNLLLFFQLLIWSIFTMLLIPLMTSQGVIILVLGTCSAFVVFATLCYIVIPQGDRLFDLYFFASLFIPLVVLLLVLLPILKSGVLLNLIPIASIPLTMLILVLVLLSEKYLSIIFLWHSFSASS